MLVDGRQVSQEWMGEKGGSVCVTGLWGAWVCTERCAEGLAAAWPREIKHKMGGRKSGESLLRERFLKPRVMFKPCLGISHGSAQLASGEMGGISPPHHDLMARGSKT